MSPVKSGGPAARRSKSSSATRGRRCSLIDDLLDLSRIMSGQIPPRRAAGVAGRHRRGRGRVVEPAAQTQGHAAGERCSTRRSVPCPAIPARLQQVFWNLLTNAIKFTPKGGKVQVLLQRVNSHVELSVSDTGIGIPAGFLPHVFDRFSNETARARALTAAWVSGWRSRSSWSSCTGARSASPAQAKVKGQRSLLTCRCRS